MDEMLQVYVSYATAREEFLHPMRVPEGTTIGAAIEGSGVLLAYPEINLVTQPVGIFAKKKTLDTVLRDRDRIEIYRPLVADPAPRRAAGSAHAGRVPDLPRTSLTGYFFFAASLPGLRIPGPPREAGTITLQASFEWRAISRRVWA